EEIEANIAVRGHAIEARIYAENPDQGFIPDSGRLLHVRLPKETEDVRIDAGFVAGDEVSAHYDPMISKLIVRGANREEALRNLSVALEEYEIAGPITNIEFLKAVCKSADFASGAVETGYIEKHREELFVKEAAPDEVLAQVALAIFTKRADSGPELTSSGLKGSQLGFSSSFQQRQFKFAEMASSATPDAANPTHDVQVRQLSSDSFRVTVNGRTFEK
ncbi:hypothetical protein F66182_18668, partial [Fusarium sp. NRRL 66182]